jgi:hypothetical protein
MHKKEENALGVRKDSTEKWRKENNIPDSDRLALMMEDQQKRGISDTVSTTLSDSHDAKRAKLIGIPEYIFCTIMCCKRNQKFNVICRYEPVCGTKFRARAQPLSHDPKGWLISPKTPMPAPWVHTVKCVKGMFFVYPVPVDKISIITCSSDVNVDDWRRRT